ncbi:MAG: hypothetical protein NC388_07475 [Clostridium sp.]|nr:hypothetical protein [Clostridium sp.]
MALAIANIPVLEGDEAENFVRMAHENESRRGSVDLTEAVATMREILKKAKL